MAQINFPAASESPWYNPDNGVTYEYIGGTWRTVTTASQLDDIYVKEIGDTMTGELILHGNPAQNLGATPKQYVDNAISDSEDSERLTSDGRYLRKDAAAGNQDVLSPSTTRFLGSVFVDSGLTVDNNSGTKLIVSGTTYDNSKGIDVLNNNIVPGDKRVITLGALDNNTGYLRAVTGDFNVINGDSVSVSVEQTGDVLVANNAQVAGGVTTNTVVSPYYTVPVSYQLLGDRVFNIAGDIEAGGTAIYGIRIIPTKFANTDASVTTQTVSGIQAGAVVTEEAANAVSIEAYNATAINPAIVAANLKNYYGYTSSVSIAKPDGANADYAAYNFYASGNAENFFQGDTYIGGTATRNTRELWESTLTEEQKEQLSAGTLAIPANVSTPGDGSFVRQWWYNQQSAENQALIDSGELEYPERYQAANFVDTFALGTDTNINLLNTGLGEFKAGVKVTGGDDPTKASIYGATGALNLSDGIGRRCVYGPFNTIFDNRSTPADTTGNNTGYVFRHNNSTTGDVNAVDCVSASLTADLHDKNVESVALYTASELTLSNIDNLDAASGFRCSNSLLNRSANTAAFRAEIESGNGTNYNFYAAGTAPNYFRGDIVCAPTGDTTRSDLYAGAASGFAMNPGGETVGSRNTNDYLATLSLSRGGSQSGRAFIDFFIPGGTRVGKITTDGANITIDGQASDYRIKTNIQPLASTVDTIKALKPVTFEYTDRNVGQTYKGFVAHELQEAGITEAVTGTKDETEAIGTLYDFDGTVLKTEVTEPTASELEYTEEVETDGVATMVTRTRTWTATGTRPVYQGVDQTKLIPLLTKALQEALTRIEELESNTLQPLYATLADLPDASDHHGKTAHVHSEGALYFAHGGNWVKLQNA